MVSRHKALRSPYRNEHTVLKREVGISVGQDAKIRKSTAVFSQNALCSGGPGLWDLLLHRSIWQAPISRRALVK